MAGYSVDSVRSELRVLQDWTYLNTGTVGVTAEPVLSTLLEHIAAYERGGHPAQTEAAEHYNQSKEALARLINVNSDEIAFNRNASDGINFVAAGFPLEPEDEVITTDEEHPAMVLPWLAACDRSGARLRFIDVSHDPAVFADNLRQQLTSRTRAVAMSHVSCETGTRLPVQVVREVVGPDVAILIDASQSVGQFPVDVQAMHADFVIGNGHKWLAGPKGTGFAWFRPESIHLAPPVYFHSDTVDPRWTRAYYQQDPAPGLKISSQASRFEFGTRSWHLFASLKDAIEYQECLGWSHIESHMASMSAQAKSMLADIRGITLHTPERWEDSSGIVTFSIDGFTGEEASQRLWNDFRIVQRRVETPSSVRISCAYFTNDEDLGRLYDAVAQLARSG